MSRIQMRNVTHLNETSHTRTGALCLIKMQKKKSYSQKQSRPVSARGAGNSSLQSSERERERERLGYSRPLSARPPLKGVSPPPTAHL